MGHQNLPLGMLVLMLRELDETEKIQLLLDDLKAKSYSVRVLHRNQRFAHIDYAVAMEGKKLPPMSSISRNQAHTKIPNPKHASLFAGKSFSPTSISSFSQKQGSLYCCEIN